MEKKDSAKERILRVAEELFYQEGIRAVGIDRIILESGVAKASFYRSFATKDDLVVAFLELRQLRSLGTIDRVRREHPDAPLEQLYALMDTLTERMEQHDYRGCPFMNTAVEFPDPQHPGHAKALEVRNVLWAEVGHIAMEAGVPQPEELAEQLRMLWSGAAMVAYMNKTEFKPESFSTAAKTLIDNQMAAKRG